MTPQDLIIVGCGVALAWVLDRQPSAKKLTTKPEPQKIEQVQSGDKKND